MLSIPSNAVPRASRWNALISTPRFSRSARRTTSHPFLGLNAQPDETGKLVVQSIVPGSAADAAGLLPGDVLIKVGEVEARADGDWGARYRERYQGQDGHPLTISITRGGKPVTLNTQVRERTAVSFTLAPAASPTPKQARIWRGIATGSTGN